MDEDTPLGLVLFAMIFSLFLGVYLFRSGWRFWKEGIYTPSFLENLLLQRSGSMKDKDADERHRRLPSLNKRRFFSLVNLAVGLWIILVSVVGVIVALVIQLV